MREPFLISDTDVEILKTKPPTPESLGRAALLGFQLGSEWLNRSAEHRLNLIETVHETIRTTLAECPFFTVERFSTAVHRTLEYVDSRQQLQILVGEAVLADIEQQPTQSV